MMHISYLPIFFLSPCLLGMDFKKKKNCLSWEQIHYFLRMPFLRMGFTSLIPLPFEPFILNFDSTFGLLKVGLKLEGCFGLKSEGKHLGVQWLVSFRMEKEYQF